MRSSFHCCNEKEISIKYSECVLIALGTQHAMFNHLWPAPLCNIYPHYLTNGTVIERLLLRAKRVF